MADKLETGIALTKRSLKVISSRKQFLLIPLTSVAITILMAIIILSPLIKIEEAAWITHQVTNKQYVFYIVMLITFFTVTHVITTFNNTLITTCLLNQIQNKPTTLCKNIKHGLKISHHLLIWALILGTFGIGIRFCESWLEHWRERPFTQRMFLGMKWISATYLIIPVLADQHLAPLKAIRESARLVQATWGDEVDARITPGPIFFILFLVALIPFLTTTYLFETRIYMYSGVIITICLFIILSIIKSTLKLTTLTALYLYAKGNQHITTLYPEDLLKKAFFAKRTTKHE